jgi:hypothetical protein
MWKPLIINYTEISLQSTSLQCTVRPLSIVSEGTMKNKNECGKTTAAGSYLYG